MTGLTPTVAAQFAPAASGNPLAARTRLLLVAPIVPTLLRLAAPNVVVIMVQAVVNAGEAYFLGWLGPEALAGVSMVFPLIMLMQTMSAGGMGGGVSSAIARALGGGRRNDPDSLAAHALVITGVFGLAFTTSMTLGGRLLYRAMGGTDAALEAVLAYSNVVFGGALAFWLFITLASILRSSGNMLLPAAVTVGGAVLTLGLSPAMIFGRGPFPALGIAGAGAALIIYYYYGLGSLVLIGYFLSGRSLVRLRPDRVRFRWAYFREILGIGAPGALNTIQANLTVVLLTGLVGPFGTFALAGYGMGTRLEYLQIPLVFGFGSALVTLVGTNVGAGQRARAERVAWLGAGMAAAVTGSIGLCAALFPSAWLGIFSGEPEVLAAGISYLRIVGPTYGFFGLGLGLYFAFQGAGRLMWPLLAGFSRLVVASAGSWIAIRWLGGGLASSFAAMAFAFIVYGVTLALAVRSGAWRSSAPPRCGDS